MILNLCLMLKAIGMRCQKIYWMLFAWLFQILANVPQLSSLWVAIVVELRICVLKPEMQTRGQAFLRYSFSMANPFLSNYPSVTCKTQKQ